MHFRNLPDTFGTLPKYHWRHNDGENALYQLDVPHTVRSRQTFRQLVAQPLINDGYPAKLVTCTVNSLKELVLSGKSVSGTEHEKILQGKVDMDSVLKTSQVTIFGEPEVRYLRQLSADIINPLRQELSFLWENQEAELSKEQINLVIDTLKKVSEKELKKNLKGMRVATGLDAAMFGRMATSDILARGDAAIHVAHAFTTHAEESESDYFSAIDELVASMGEGELGSGKTAFLQGFAKGLGVKENITSPTFVILKRFRINSPGSSLCVRKNSSSKFKNFYHIDCYRIKGVKEIINLGLKEIIAEPKNIVAIEWAERVGRIMPKNSVRIKFNFIDEKRRIIFRNF